MIAPLGLRPPSDVYVGQTNPTDLRVIVRMTQVRLSQLRSQVFQEERMAGKAFDRDQQRDEQSHVGEEDCRTAARQLAKIARAQSPSSFQA